MRQHAKRLHVHDLQVHIMTEAGPDAPLRGEDVVAHLPPIDVAVKV